MKISWEYSGKIFTGYCGRGIVNDIAYIYYFLKILPKGNTIL